MTFRLIDDKFYSHPKVVGISRTKRPAAVGLWTMAGCWSAAHGTDGRVPSNMVRELGFTIASAEALVEVGLWSAEARPEVGHASAEPRAFVFHDWADWNPTREQIEAKKRAARERQSRSREHRRSGDSVTRDSSVTDTRDGATTDTARHSAPSHPIPSHPIQSPSDSLPPPTAAVRVRAADAEFDEFWKVYPRRDAKADAKRAFAKAMRKPGVTLDVLLAGVQRYVDNPDRKYDAHAATWLNGERWTDEGSQSQSPRGRPTVVRSTTDDRVNTTLQRAARYAAAEQAATPHQLPLEIGAAG